MRMAALALIVAAAVSLPPSLHAAEPLTAAKGEDIRRLLQATGALSVAQLMSEAVVSQMSAALKRARPDLPAHVFDVLAETVNEVIAEEMVARGGFVDAMILLYHRHFTHEEIRGLVAFYETPLGRKAGSLAPIMSQEGLRIGQQWGESLGPKIAERVKARLKQEGIEL
ncbi:MAG TPA: DUF2059 domain-containing protein [Thermodesulfobacteriota bacterium]